ncbi:Tubby-like protein [Globisporangium polare]
MPAANAANTGASNAADVPNLLRQYEESLTLAISPRNASSRRSMTSSGVSNRDVGSASAASPRAVYHSPNAFSDNPPALPMFSPKRRSFHQNAGNASFADADGDVTTSTAQAVDAEITSAINLSFEEEEGKAEDDDELHLESKKPALTSQKSSSPVAAAGKELQEESKDPDAPEDSEGCLICMDEFSARRKAYPLPCTGQCTGAYVHYRCIMAWLGQSGSCPLCRGVCDPLVLQPLQKLELQDMHKTALQPVPLDAGIIRCYVKQVYRGMFKQYGYELFLQGQIGTQEEDRFLLAARRQVRSNMTANYVICTDKDCTETNRIGRMGSNFLGTCFTLYDNGRDPQKIAKIQDAVSSADDLVVRNVLQIREELGCVTYEPNRTSVGPRKMRVVIPDVDENGVSSKVVRPMSRQDRLVTRLSGGDLKDLMKFSNREPVFREDLGAYCLDFGGRVSMASVKNFQLINTEDPSMGNILQFGRVADDMFTMDFQWPLSPFQAFSICLSSCDTKLACV